MNICASSSKLLLKDGKDGLGFFFFDVHLKA